MRARRLATSIGFVFACLTWGAGQAAAQSDIQGIGTWKLNLTKSKLGKGPAPKSMISTIEAVGDSTRVTGVRIGADGIRFEARFTARTDGKDYPIRGSANADTVSLTRVDARTIERVDKRSGKVVETSVTVYSADGKVSTTRGKGVSSGGEVFDYVIVNEKQ